MSFLRDFGGGFARQLTENLIDERDRMNKLADDETMLATRQRLAKKAKRDEEQEIADNLVESLSLYFTPEQIEDIVPRGKIAVAHAVSKGKFYDEKGMSASSMYTMPNNDIASIDTANITSIGEISKTADVPEGMGTDSFASRFTPIKPTKEFKTIAAFQVALLEERINAGDDPDKIAIVDEKEKQFFAQASKLEDAKRKPDDVDGIKEFYSPSQRLELIKNQRTIARNTLDLSVGSMGQLVGKYKGTNKLGMAELDTAIMLQNQNDVVAKEESLYGEIKAIAKNAKVTLDSYAQSKILSKDEDTYKMFESETLMKEAADSGALPIGSVYAVANPEGGYLIGTYVGNTYKDVGIPSYLNAATVGANFFNAE